MILALCEVLLRVGDRPRLPTIGWTAHVNPAERNEVGVRGRRATGPADLTVLLLGDAQVESMGPFDEMPEVFLTAALARETGRAIRVASLGVSGWGQDQQLLALRKHGSRLAPRVVLLWFTPTTALWQNTFPTYFPPGNQPKPTFWLEGEALCGPHAPWLGHETPGVPRLWLALKRLAGQPLHVTDRTWERRIPPPARLRPHGPVPVPELRQLLAQRYGVEPAEVPYLEHESFTNEKTHFSVFQVPRSPRLAYSARLTRALLSEIDATCHALGARFVVLASEIWEALPPEPTDLAIGAGRITLSAAAAEALVQEILAGLDVVRIRQLPPGTFVSRTNHHLNRDGKAYVMDELARALAPTLASRLT